MKLKKVTGLTKQQKEFQECYQLWKDCFGDSDQYMDYYFSEKLKDNTIYMLEVDEHVVSMLHLNPYEMKLGEENIVANYIVGVATEESYRKRGYMGRLLRAVFTDLYEKGQLFTYLMPAAYAIYAPYDFRYVYEQNRLGGNVNLAEEMLLKAAELQDTAMTEWDKLSSEEKKKAVEFVNSKLIDRFDLITLRSKAYYDRMALEMQAADGNLYVAKRQQQVIGVLSYMSEVGEEGLELAMVESVIAEEETALVYELLKEKLAVTQANLTLYESAFLNVEELQETIGKMETKVQPIIMARILRVEKMLETLRAEQKTSKVIAVEDPFLKENNKTFEIVYDQKGCQVRETEASPEIRMNIAELTEWVFGQKSCYINEIV